MKMVKKLSLIVTVWLLILTSCGPSPRYTSVTGDERSSREGESKIDKTKMSRIIDSFLGTPYRFGGETRSGTDCSGLVKQVYRQYAGFDLPRDTKKLYKLVRKVESEDLAYGDLVFFSDGWYSVSHVGIYVGERKFVHSTKDLGVVVSSLDENYYRKRYRGARRVIP